MKFGVGFGESGSTRKRGLGPSAGRLTVAGCAQFHGDIEETTPLITCNRWCDILVIIKTKFRDLVGHRDHSRNVNEGFVISDMTSFKI